MHGLYGNICECMEVCLGLCIRPLPNVQISHMLRDAKHISQSQEYENVNEFSGGVGKGLAQNSTHYSIPTVPNTPTIRLSNLRKHSTLIQNFTTKVMLTPIHRNIGIAYLHLR